MIGIITVVSLAQAGAVASITSLSRTQGTSALILQQLVRVHRRGSRHFLAIQAAVVAKARRFVAQYVVEHLHLDDGGRPSNDILVRRRKWW